MYSIEEKVLIWLDLFEFASLKKVMELVEHYDDLSKLWTNFEKDKEYLSKLYTVDVSAYNVVSKDKTVSALQFHYYGGKLFAVTEMLNISELSPQKLESSSVIVFFSVLVNFLPVKEIFL